MRLAIELMADKPTLDELFQLAAIPRSILGEVARKLHRREIGKAKAMRYAQLLLKHNFSNPRAYAEFTRGRPAKNNSRWAFNWWRNKTVQLYLGELMQQAIDTARAMTRDDVEDMIQVTHDLIFGDVTSLLKKVRIFNSDGTVTEQLVLRDFDEMTKSERMMVHKIKWKDGRVTSLEAYSRLDAIRTHIPLVQMLHNRGGADGDFNSEFAKRLGDAREKRIALEVAAGKVVRLPSRNG